GFLMNSEGFDKLDTILPGNALKAYEISIIFKKVRNNTITPKYDHIITQLPNHVRTQSRLIALSLYHFCNSCPA
ncbi:MAG: hypothetical protein ACOCW8_03090, partial [bacterium]